MYTVGQQVTSQKTTNSTYTNFTVKSSTQSSQVTIITKYDKWDASKMFVYFSNISPLFCTNLFIELSRFYFAEVRTYPEILDAFSMTPAAINLKKYNFFYT